MSRPVLEVADIFRDHGAAWRRANAGHVSLDQMKVMSAIERCRTAALGGHVARCEGCAHTVIAYNSCLMGKICNGELAGVDVARIGSLTADSWGFPSFLLSINSGSSRPAGSGHQGPVTERDPDAGDIFFGGEDP